MRLFHIHQGLGWAMFMLVGISSAASGAGGGSPVPSGAPPPGVGPRTITVIGQGRATANPDIATAVLGVETVSKNLQQGLEQNNAKIAALLKTLRGSGVAERDVQTVHFSATPERKFIPSSGPGEITGYRIINDVQVKFRDLGKMGTILDRIVAGGGNVIRNLAYGLDDPRPLQHRASASAVAAAHSKATEIAKAANVSLGEVLQISESFREPMPLFQPQAMSAAKSAAVPMEAGELEIAAQIQVVYAIR